MSDDLFEFLAVRKRGVLPRKRRRATEEAQLPAEVPPIIDKIKNISATSAGSGNPGMPDWMRDLRFGVSATQTISPISTWTSRCGRVLFVGFGPIVQKAQIW